METALKFEHVSKKYQLGIGKTGLRDALAQPFRRMRRRGAQAQYDDQILWALKDVDFALERGAALALLGPNGAGKSTILKLLAHITTPTAGKIEINGRIGTLIELGAGFHPDLTGRENVYLNGAILGLSLKEIDRVFDRIVDFSGLARFIDTPVKRYSSGMYVRLGFSVAAHINPDILLVDEVLAVGDAQFLQKCIQRISELRRNGTTIVFVSHNVYLVKSVCDVGLFILNGQIQDQGDTVSIIRSYEAWLHQRQAEGAARPEPDDSRALESGLVDITDVELYNSKGGQADSFGYQESVEVRVYYRARQKIDSPNLAVHIVRPDGTTCCMIKNMDYGYPLQDLTGEGAISLTIDPLQLVGGTYSVDAFIDGAFEGIQLAGGHSSWFHVTGPSIAVYESAGVFVPHVSLIKLTPGGEPGPG
ncbi:MAG: ABC transporter ATP-binding protein [Anaerolineae bacterium]